MIGMLLTRRWLVTLERKTCIGKATGLQLMKALILGRIISPVSLVEMRTLVLDKCPYRVGA